MTFQEFWQGADISLRVYLILSAVGLLGIVCYVVVPIMMVIRRYRPPVNDDQPEEFGITTREGARIVFERINLGGEWRYVVKGRFPYLTPLALEAEKQRLRNSTPLAIEERG